jgi:hypothetical protein
MFFLSRLVLPMRRRENIPLFQGKQFLEFQISQLAVTYIRIPLSQIFQKMSAPLQFTQAFDLSASVCDYRKHIHNKGGVKMPPPYYC